MSGASEFGKDEGVVHETIVTGRKAGWGHTAWSRLAENEGLMRSLLPVIMGQAHVEANTYIIDLDAAPFIPNGWKIESHKKGGSFEWDPTKVALHLEPEQIAFKPLKGFDLQKRLEGKPVFNATMLDWFLAHTELIPESWKQDDDGNTRYIFFWGTVYRRSGGGLCVRCLYWEGDRWHRNADWLENVFGGLLPALLFAS